MMTDEGLFGYVGGVIEVRIRSGSWESKENDLGEGMSTGGMMCTYN